MKKIFNTCLFFLLFIWVNAAERDTLLFTGDTLPGAIGDTLVFNQTLYVCGRTSSYYLYLSYERLREPEDVAERGTPAYDSLLAKFNNGILKLYCPYVKQKDTIRLGATVHNLVAMVAGARYVKSYAPSLDIRDNERPTQRPDVGDASLIICEANLQHYCPDWEGSLSDAESDSDYLRQHAKLMKALSNIDADIFALTELQTGERALQNIVNGLNESSLHNTYAYVDDRDTAIVQNIKVGFLYRTDKVRPILALGHPYGTTWQEIAYHNREYVQCFEELATGERFVLAMNHFKAGAGDSTQLATRLANAQHLTDFIDVRLRSRYYQDADVMLVGDFNSFAQEAPIRHIDTSGFENQLMRFAPNDYTYAYYNSVEYLDYVFTTPSLSAQVTGVAPYHINTDESDIYYYAYGDDTSMYRYADHDPIIIGLKLHTEQIEIEEDTVCNDLNYEESFGEDFGKFHPFTTCGSSSWLWHRENGCAYANGYYSGENEENWLLSPYFNLTHTDSVWFSFRHTIGYGTQTLWPARCQLLIATDFRGNPAAATWDTLPLQLPATAWEWRQDSLTLPATYLGRDSVVIAFRYNDSVGGDIPVWFVKDFALSSRCMAEPPAPVDTIVPIDTLAIQDNAFANLRIYGIEGAIVADSETPVAIEVFDLLGREIARREQATREIIAVPRGIYLVRCDRRQVKKVLVR